MRVPADAAARLGRGPAAIQCLTKGRFDQRLVEINAQYQATDVCLFFIFACFAIYVAELFDVTSAVGDRAFKRRAL